MTIYTVQSVVVMHDWNAVEHTLINAMSESGQDIHVYVPKDHPLAMSQPGWTMTVQAQSPVVGMVAE